MRVYAGWEGGMQRQPSQALRASSPRGGNGDDRRQRRKQGGAVGAAASRMRGPHQGPKQTLGAATRVRSTSGVSVRFMLDERSTIWRKRAGLATEGSSFWTSAPCQAAAGLDSGALPFPRYCALLVQTKPDRHAKGSPSGGNGDDRRQRRKQGGAVGAAASRMRGPHQGPKQTLGAATRPWRAQARLRGQAA